MTKKINTTKKTLLTVFLMLVSFTYASNRKADRTLKIETGNGKTVSIILSSAEEASLFIYDHQHHLIYESTINKLEVSKTISLEGYAAGTYFLEVKENGSIAKHEIKVPAKKIKTLRIDESVNESPSFRR
ncbi:hypothetical protein HNP37_004600 [Flavobacterium nitrogenifigens]|uniref:Por secretion system C-terminal sorting domain-containing protein n=2 Tax=Flavobacterium TaxID=237 RepID=A0A7W7J258_9FLAO|nr:MULTISPECIES: secretion protein [Flavobacterium]MBB4804508.1 hypothetical protein [Flavobacterium nitrogenifigens]MBB6389364.1 hypothetical protein [Flavobacterium notoginsengisoli]